MKEGNEEKEEGENRRKEWNVNKEGIQRRNCRVEGCRNNLGRESWKAANHKKGLRQ